MRQWCWILFLQQSAFIYVFQARFQFGLMSLSGIPCWCPSVPQRLLWYSGGCARRLGCWWQLYTSNSARTFVARSWSVLLWNHARIGCLLHFGCFWCPPLKGSDPNLMFPRWLQEFLTFKLSERWKPSVEPRAQDWREGCSRSMSNRWR